MRPIAIIGASCRFPGANGLEEFWELLRAGRNAIGTVPKDRWDAAALVDENPESRVSAALRHGAFIQKIREFDCAFFGISPREAAAMDPQQRLLLETAYEAFEDAGIPMDQLAGSQTAVYVGIGPGDYGRMCAQPWEGITAHYVTGNFLSTAVDRLSYFFDLRGPSMAVDTACSSSLVSVHLACRSLDSGEAEIALAGGVNAVLAPTLSISLAKAGALSPSGQCRSFDAEADGYVRGEGAGFVVLKHLDKAVADGDRIYAAIRGTAVRQGGRRNGVTAPGGWGQEAVMKAAWEVSGISPSGADYVEAQGTGTVLGDAIEANAISKVFGARNGRGPCRMGSVKTNIGHLETAAGVASLIKVALMLHHGECVGSLYPQKLNPHINLAKLGLDVSTVVEPWAPSHAAGRAGGVSAFGMGGTYAHVCITDVSAEGEPEGKDDGCVPGFVLPLSARHPSALQQLVQQTVRLIERSDAKSLHDCCRAAATRRTHHEYRAAFAGLSVPEVADAMNSWVRNPPAIFKVSGKRKLVAVISECGDSGNHSSLPRQFGADCPKHDEDWVGRSGKLLGILEKWGLRPAEFLRQEQGRIIRRTGNTSTGKALAFEELMESRADILDMTPENLLARHQRSGANATLLAGFSTSETDVLTPLRIVARLYELGHPVAWRQVYSGVSRQMNLPNYPWQRQECWLESLNPGIAPRGQSPPLPRRALLPSNGNLRSLLSRLSGVAAEQIHQDSSLSDLGIDSLLILELQEELRRISGVVVPVEVLVQMESVKELESVLQSAAMTSGATRISAPIGSTKRSIELGEAALDDYDRIASVLRNSGLTVKDREEWELMWTGNPVRKKRPEWPIGWVVREGAEIVGFLGNIPLSYQFRGREILAAGLHAFALEASHRGMGLLLLDRLVEFATEVEYFVGSSANLNSSAVLDRVGVERVPVGDWENSSFWITNYDGFVSSAISKKGLPDSLAGAGSVALKIFDRVSKTGWPDQKHDLTRIHEFDEQFDFFWEELCRAYQNRFLANRSREHLLWHFKRSLTQGHTWVLTHCEGARIAAYGIFQRHDYREIKLQRVRLVDFQALPGFENILPSMLANGLNEARTQGIHMLEAFGFRPDKQDTIDRLAPHHRKLAAWSYFHKIVSPALRNELQDVNAWDPSQYDGDSSL